MSPLSRRRIREEQMPIRAIVIVDGNISPSSRDEDCRMLEATLRCIRFTDVRIVHIDLLPGISPESMTTDLIFIRLSSTRFDDGISLRRWLRMYSALHRGTMTAVIDRISMPGPDLHLWRSFLYHQCRDSENLDFIADNRTLGESQT